MPRLPDTSAVRPVPQSSRQIATVRNAGAVAEAAAGLGDTIAGVGKQLLEKDDKLRYAAARTAILQADTKARQELLDDPDYGTFETRYTEKMQAAREKASGLIQSASDRGLFEMDAKLDFERGRAQVLDLARGKRVSAEKAMLRDGLDTLHDTARSATDNETRSAAIETAREMIAGAMTNGSLSAEEAQAMREDWASAYVHDQVATALNRDDVDGATSLLEQHGDKLDWRQRLALEDRTRGMIENREAVSIVDELMGIGTREGGDIQYSDPLRGKGRAPVPGGKYGAGRDYGAHQGVDFPAPNGTPVHSIAAGVAKVTRSEKGGNIVTVTHGDGRVSRYMHLGAVNVKDGDRVSPDTVVGTVGTTGRSSGPHLHLEVKENGKPVNPGAVIGKAAQSPRRHDLNALYGQIDAEAAQRGWSPERVERLKQEVDRRVSRDEMLANREEDAAMRDALTVVDSLGDSFTDISQIPNASKLSPRDRMQLENVAEAHRKPVEPKAHGEVAVALKLMAARDEQRFKATDLRQYAPFMTPGEFESLVVDQAKLQEAGDQPATANVRSEIDTAIRFYGKDISLDAGERKNDEQRETYSRIYDSMRAYLDRATDGGKRKPTDDDLKNAFDSATMKVIVRGGGWFGDAEKRRYEIEKGGRIGVPIPAPVRTRIETTFRKNGVKPTEQMIAETYLSNKGKPGFWK